MVESWKAISGYEGIYEVSDQGRVRSLSRHVKRGSGLVKFAGRILRPGLTKAGYPLVVLCKGGRESPSYVHRLVIETFNGPRPDGQECRHRNGDESDCRLDNPQWGTKLENEHDKIDHGTVVEGMKNGCAILCDADVVEIRTRYQSGVSLLELEDRFGVTRRQILDVATGVSWKHIPMPPPKVRKKHVRHKSWTLEEELLIQDLPLEEAALRVGRTTVAVEMWLWRLRGPKQTPLSKADKPDATETVEEDVFSIFGDES